MAEKYRAGRSRRGKAKAPEENCGPMRTRRPIVPLHVGCIKVGVGPARAWVPQGREDDKGLGLYPLGNEVQRRY